MKAVAVAHASTISALTIKYMTVSATVKETDTISGMSQTSNRFARNGRKTMVDYISRQAAIRWVKTECNPYGKPTLDFESGKKVIEHLEQMPPAEERKAGTWKEFRGNKNMCICQSCGFMVNKSLLYDYTEKDPLVFKYCPSCGSYNGGAKRR